MAAQESEAVSLSCTHSASSNVFGIPRNDDLDTSNKLRERDPGCCGRSNYVYPFKVNLEGAIRFVHSAMDDTHPLQSDTP